MNDIEICNNLLYETMRQVSDYRYGTDILKTLQEISIFITTNFIKLELTAVQTGRRIKYLTVFKTLDREQ